MMLSSVRTALREWNGCTPEDPATETGDRTPGSSTLMFCIVSQLHELVIYLLFDVDLNGIRPYLFHGAMLTINRYVKQLPSDGTAIDDA